MNEMEHGAGRLFEGRGEMRATCRATDWAATPLGPVEAWPAALRSVAALVLAAPVPMVLLWGGELAQLYNDGYRAVMGAKHPRGLGQPTRECWPELWSFNAPLYERVMRGGESFTFTDHRLRVERNGASEEAFFTLTFSPVFGDDGGVRGVLVTVFETTAQVHARDTRERERERTLAETEEARARVTATLESIGDAFYAVDGDFRFTYINRRAEELWGRSRESLLGRLYWEEFPEAVGSVSYQRHLRVMEERRADHFEAISPIVGHWLDISLYPDERGGLACYFRDITDRKAAEAEHARLLSEADAARRDAERSAQVTSSITTHLGEGVCMMDAGGRLTYMNPAAEGILGWTAEELRGHILHDRVHYKRPDGSPYPMSECPLGRTLNQAEPVLGLRDQWIRRDGSFVHVVTTCSPITEDGRVVGAVLSLHDDTQRRQVEAERERLLGEAQRARAEAEEANRAKSQFLAVMSHELRTPLNAIGGYAELIEMGLRGPVTEVQRDDLRRIQTSQRHLLGLINEVLNYAKLETGTVHFELEDVPLRETLAAAESLVAPQARARGLTLAVAECPPSVAVRADAEKLRQVLVNLLSNAVKFTDPGGRVEVTYATRSPSLVVEVSDTGIGIPADKLHSIFDPFVQVRSDLTRPHEGTGLGLAISRDLARGMGGDLTVRSAPGGGSTFTLALPAAS